MRTQHSALKQAWTSVVSSNATVVGGYHVLASKTRRPLEHVARVVGHVTHVDAPGAAVYVPFVQSEQLLAPRNRATLPFAQRTALALPPAHAEPAGHWTTPSPSPAAELLR